MTGELWRLGCVHADWEIAAGAAPILTGAAYVERLPGSSAANAWFTPDGRFDLGPVRLCFHGVQLLKRARGKK